MIKKKAIEPLIAAILLIVVAVILITIVLNWGKMFTTKSLEKVETLELNKSDVEHFIYPKKTNSDAIQFVYSPPISENFGEVKLKSYKILYGSEETEDINLSIEHSLNAGLNIINISNTSLDPEIDFSSKVTLILKTTDGYYITLKNISFENLNSNSSGESEEDSGATESSEKDIISFTINDINGIIDTDNNTITFSYPYGTSVTSLTPTITISEYATIYPASGFSQNFTDSVTYTVTAEDNSTKTYTVSITILAPEVPLSSEKDIIYFTINDINGIIDQDLNTIAFELESGTDVTSLTPTITISEEATISPASGNAQDFTNSVTYTVTAKDNSTKTYTVSITIGSESIVDANLPYVMFGTRKLYIQPSGSNQNDGTGNNDSQFTWDNAVAYCDNLDANGYDDWYLPSATQLRAIWDTYTYLAGDSCLDSDGYITTACINSTILATNTNFVSLVGDYYWSSTEYGSGDAYKVRMRHGIIGDDDKDDNYYVRCVRDFVDSVDPVDPVDLPYVIFDRALYIQPDQNTTQMNWTTAVAYCDNLDANGYDDWYLPSATQLRAIWDTYTYLAGDSCLDSSGYITTACINSTILATNTNFVSLVGDYYWSSTEYGSDSAYRIYMANGLISYPNKYHNGSVRCVRDQ